MTKAFLIDGIAKLGNWNCSMAGEDLSTIKFYDDSGNEISRPDDFPTDEQIQTAQAEEQARRDNIPNVKASAKAKLMAGEALTEDEANVMIGG
jgi:hypothetical protein|tara:strand:+ start:610 stop:888 length:279 start_codon:yes stop_codon:yes gene_type:complete